MKVCPGCFSEVKYNTKYDTFYCEQCDEWLEFTCPLKDCDYCKERPEKPSKVKDNK